MSRPAFFVLLLLLLVVVYDCRAVSDFAPVSSPASPFASVYPLTLADPAIATDGPILSLDDSTWSASAPSLNLEIAGNVPGDLITDLFLAGVIPEPLYENNWLNASIWNDHVWYYNHSVSISQMQFAMLSNQSDAFDLLLTFDGIKMGADILMNDVKIGRALAQFGRLIFSLKSLLYNKTLAGAVKQGDNTLSVVFDPNIITPLFMQCTGGWDWAPFSNTTTPDGSMATFSRGIWKSVYIATVYSVAVTALTPLTTYNGPFPIAPLADGGHAGFTLNLTFHYYSARAAEARLTISPSWATTAVYNAMVRVPAGESSQSVQLRVSATDVLLWWPSGLGDQPLYDVQARLSSTSSSRTVQVSRRVGFKFFAIVTGNDTDPDYVQQYADADGTDNVGMRFRVNGAPIFARGANVIPMDTMEGRYTAAAHRRMVINAKEGGMNIMRIWGGGIILPSIFYATADEQGLLVYHDMMNRDYFSHMPAEVDAYRYTIRKLSQHVSIAIWDGCNECNARDGDIGVGVMNIVSAEDRTRPIWPSCPAQGWTSGVNRLSSLPNGKPLGPLATAFRPVQRLSSRGLGEIEGHGPYQHGDGWPAVNGDNNDLNLFDPQLPTTFRDGQAEGLGAPNFFTSEFGSVGWSSWESVAPTVAPQHWALHGGAPPDHCSGGFDSHCTGSNVMAQRNYPCDSIIISYFGGNQSDLDVVGEYAFKKQLFQCLYGQALVLKVYIEQHRSTNTYGLQIWQLNEIWPTGGWGTIEYGTVAVAGQVEGGRWKPAHHWLRDHLFTDRFISCGVNGRVHDPDNLLCFVRNDVWQAVEGALVVESIDLQTGAPQVLYFKGGVRLPGGPGQFYWFKVPAVDGATHVLSAMFYDALQDVSIARNVLLLQPPGKMQLQPVTVSCNVTEAVTGEATVDIVCGKDGPAPALFVTLTTLAQGRFSENAFLMVEESVTLQFIPFGPLDTALLVRSLRVESANMYQAGGVRADTSSSSQQNELATE